MDETPDPETLFALLGDEYVRTILRATSEEPMSARALSEECDSALSTVYRRVDDLIEAGILVEETEIDPAGSHHSVYETRLNELTVRIANGEFEMELEVERPTAERFTRMWEDIREI
ncbi:MAG: winged helix-turn-helix domain-containing protein [Haloarculaceae archaeon]